MKAHGLRADDLALALERCALDPNVERRAQTLRDKLATDHGRSAIPALVDQVLEAHASRPRPAPPGASSRPSSGHGRRRLILFHNDWFPSWEPPDLSSLDPPYETSTDGSLLAHAAVVVFHMPTLTELPRIRKLAGQRWVAWSMESEINYPVLATHHAMRHFEVTMTYRLDSTVPTVYFGDTGVPVDVSACARTPRAGTGVVVRIEPRGEATRGLSARAHHPHARRFLRALPEQPARLPMTVAMPAARGDRAVPVQSRLREYARQGLREREVLNLLTSKWVEVQRTGTTCAVSPAHLSSSNNHRLSTLRRLLAAAEQAPQPERGLRRRPSTEARKHCYAQAQGEIPEEPVNQAFTPQIA